MVAVHKPYCIDPTLTVSQAAQIAAQINWQHPEWAAQAWTEAAWLARQHEQYHKMIKYVNRAYRKFSEVPDSVCCNYTKHVLGSVEDTWRVMAPFKDYVLYAVRNDGRHKYRVGRYASLTARDQAVRDLTPHVESFGYRLMEADL